MTAVLLLQKYALLKTCKSIIEVLQKLLDDEKFSLVSPAGLNSVIPFFELRIAFWI